MSYIIENVSSCSKKLIFNYDSIDLAEEIQKSLRAKQQKVNIKGFRPGKAPLSLVEKLFKEEIQSEVQRHFISKEFFEAVNKEGLKTVGMPTFSNVEFAAGEKMKFEVIVDIFPDFELKDISKLGIEETPIIIEESEFVAVKEGHLKGHSEMVEIKDENASVQKGHFAVINFEGFYEDGSEVNGAKGTDTSVEIGANYFIPGFEDHLIDMKKGEKKEFVLTFPQDYHIQDLREKNVRFATELLEIKERKLPEYNEEFAKELGHESLSAFEEELRKNLRLQKERAEREKINQQVIDKLLELHPFDVPRSMIAMQEENIKKEMKANLKRQQFTDKMIEEYFTKWNADIESKAISQIRSSIILDRVAESYQIETNESDLDKKYLEIAENVKTTVDEVKKIYAGHENIVSNLRYVIQEEKTLNKVLELNRI